MLTSNYKKVKLNIFFVKIIEMKKMTVFNSHLQYSLSSIKEIQLDKVGGSKSECLSYPFLPSQQISELNNCHNFTLTSLILFYSELKSSIKISPVLSSPPPKYLKYFNLQQFSQPLPIWSVLELEFAVPVSASGFTFLYCFILLGPAGCYVIEYIWQWDPFNSPIWFTSVITITNRNRKQVIK